MVYFVTVDEKFLLHNLRIERLKRCEGDFSVG